MSKINYIYILTSLIFFITSCNHSNMDNLVIKEIPNSSTKYGSIRIAQDSSKYYDLKIRIPPNHRQTSFGRLSKNIAIMYEFSNQDNVNILNRDEKYIFNIVLELHDFSSIDDYVNFMMNFYSKKFNIIHEKVNYLGKEKNIIESATHKRYIGM